MSSILSLLLCLCMVLSLLTDTPANTPVTPETTGVLTTSVDEGTGVKNLPARHPDKLAAFPKTKPSFRKAKEFER